MKIRYSGVFAMLLLPLVCPGTRPARPRRPRESLLPRNQSHLRVPWRTGKMVAELGRGQEAYNSATVRSAQLDQTFYDHKLKLIDYGADMEKQDLKLQTLLDADVPNEGQVEAQVDQVLSARGKLEREFTMMNLDLRKVLSLDQWRQLKSIRGQGAGARRRRPDIFPQSAASRRWALTAPMPPDAVPLPPLPPPPETRCTEKFHLPSGTSVARHPASRGHVQDAPPTAGVPPH